MDSERTQIISDQIISTFQHMIRLLFLYVFVCFWAMTWYHFPHDLVAGRRSTPPPCSPPASEVAARSLTATTAAASRGSGRSSPRARGRSADLFAVFVVGKTWKKRQEIRGNGGENGRR